MAKQRPKPSARKQPLGEQPDRRPRGTRGRTGPAETPVEVRSPGLELSDRLAPFVREKLGSKLSAFAEHIERVRVTFTDLNGPRGGEDIECTVRVLLVARPDVVVHEVGENAQRAFERAHRRVGEAVKRDLERAGFSAGRRGARKAPKADGETSAAPEASGSKIPAASSRRSTTKAQPGARSGEKLAKRARERAHTPTAHAESSKVSRKGK